MKKRIRVPWPEEWKKQIHLSTQGTNLIYTPKDFIISFSLYIITVIACMLLRSLDETGDTSYVAMLFLTDVFLTAVLTDGYLFSILCAVLGVFSVDYIFTEPYWHISFTLAGFPLTFLVMMTISILAGALASRAKQVEVTQRQMQREKMRGNLLRAVSHDIRTPLTSIVGGIDTILDSGAELSPELQRELLQNIREESHWLIGVVENLLSVTRVSGGASIQKELEAGEEVLSSAAMKLGRRYPDVQISVRAPEELLLIPMDAILIEQVLINLMENAIQHGQTTTRLELHLRREDGLAVFEVADNGKGIAREAFPHLFEGYLSHTHEGHSDAKRNMGIGLSVCLSIVEAHGGTMEAENRAHGGAIFRFTIPLEEDNHDDQG